jgi:hypothetical protein
VSGESIMGSERKVPGGRRNRGESGFGGYDGSQQHKQHLDASHYPLKLCRDLGALPSEYYGLTAD